MLSSLETAVPVGVCAVVHSDAWTKFTCAHNWELSLKQGAYGTIFENRLCTRWTSHSCILYQVCDAHGVTTHCNCPWMALDLFLNCFKKEGTAFDHRIFILKYVAKSLFANKISQYRTSTITISSSPSSESLKSQVTKNRKRRRTRLSSKQKS